MPTFPDPDARPVPPASAGKPGSGLPPAISYARGLLRLQGLIWALLAIGFAVPALLALTDVMSGYRSWAWFAATVGVLPGVTALTGGFAIAKIRLARRLGGGQERTRKAVIGVEIAMTCLGALITAGADPSGGFPAGFFALAAITGGGLSLAAAVGLMRREARRYFADPGLAANAATDGDLDGSTGYSALRPATVVTRLRWGAGAATCQA